ncbi:unnamed protein product [Rotaria sp. Silwood2]|nr:unnamed protein product [Rotaria sp. Silwood2]CAF3051058.1 unnamed protein product [Rotaria sp. Silwood2]CAF4442574.1 unnamed protein product [Rotaria sp. Silwood2]CAF4507948.1 unnamed protein product [Rotaria sp. Silwood2]
MYLTDYTTNDAKWHVQWNKLQDEKLEWIKRKARLHRQQEQDDFDRVMEEYLWHELNELERLEEQQYISIEQKLKQQLEKERSMVDKKNATDWNSIQGISNLKEEKRNVQDIATLEDDEDVNI